MWLIGPMWVGKEGSVGFVAVLGVVIGGKGKGKVLGRAPNSSVSVIPTCPSEHPFRLAGSQTP